MGDAFKDLTLCVGVNPNFRIIHMHKWCGTTGHILQIFYIDYQNSSRKVALILTLSFPREEINLVKVTMISKYRMCRTVHLQILYCIFYHNIINIYS